MTFTIDLRNKNVSEYHLSVINNAKVDKIKFFSHFKDYADYSIYLKVESDDHEYIDKIAIEQGDISIVEDALVIDWTLSAISTRFKKIYVQLQFEKQGDIAQSRIVGIILNDTIDVDKGLKRLYPKVLERLEEEVKNLEERVTRLEEGN